MKIVFAYDHDGILAGPVALNDSDVSPLEPGVYLVPGNCTDVQPPTPGDGQLVRWVGESWQVEAIVVPEEPEPEPLPELPPAPRRVTSLEFLDLFSEEEQLAVITAAMSSPQINLWWTKLTMATFVDFEDPRLAAGLQALVTAGLLTAERAQEVLQ